MKRTKIFFCLFYFSTILLRAQHQTDINLGGVADFNNISYVDDSDETLRYDYYSSVSYVRSGLETYCVKSGVRYKSEMLFAYIHNRSNTTIGHPDYCKISGEQLIDYNWYSPDESLMREVVKKVFPKCITGRDSARDINNQQNLCIYMAVDPDTEKVIDMEFCIDSDKPGITARHTLFSLPPSKLRQLEELIKGNVTVKIPDEAKFHTYLRSKYRIYFKKFEL